MSASGLDFPEVFLNLTVPGDPSLLSCWASYTSYRASSYTHINHELPYSTSRTWWTDPRPSITVNPCDGITRISGVASALITVTYTNLTSQSTEWKILPAPACTISKQSDCSSLYDVYALLSTSWMSSYSTYAKAHNKTRGAVIRMGALTPPCTRDSDIQVRECAASYSTAKSVDCRISASHPTVFYWPTRADVCNSNNIASTALGNGNEPIRTAVYQGATVTSPSALIVMHTVHAMSFSVDGTSIPYIEACAKEMGDVTVSVAPPDLSSATWTTNWRSNSNYSFPVSALSPAAFNFADLNSAPWSAYVNDMSCFTGWPQRTFDTRLCPNTIWDDYTPIMYLPTTIKDLKGMPTNCPLENTFFWPATYIPITTDILTVPTPTYWGVTAGDANHPLTPTPHGAARIEMKMPIETGKINEIN